MNLVDTSGWLEYLADGDNADFFAPPLESVETLVVPTICVLEVFKRTLQQRGEDAALKAAAVMREGLLVELDLTTALAAATVGHERKLPLADGVILATARAHNAVLWTQDADFERFEGVRFIAKRSR